MARLALTAVVSGAVVVFSSAPAIAGFRYFSADHFSAGDLSNATADGPATNSGLLAKTILDFDEDAVQADARFLASPSEPTPSVAIGDAFGISSAMEQIADATPSASQTPPLLIPVPTAISSGLCGLLVLAVLAASRWMRRRVFR
jgi:hypothetical protein